MRYLTWSESMRTDCSRSRMTDCGRAKVSQQGAFGDSLDVLRTSCPRRASFCQASTSFLRFRISERISRESSWCIAEEGIRFFEMDSFTCLSITGVTLAENARATWFAISGRIRTRSISLGRL